MWSLSLHGLTQIFRAMSSSGVRSARRHACPIPIPHDQAHLDITGNRREVVPHAFQPLPHLVRGMLPSLLIIKILYFKILPPFRVSSHHSLSLSCLSAAQTAIAPLPLACRPHRTDAATEHPTRSKPTPRLPARENRQRKLPSTSCSTSFFFSSLIFQHPWYLSPVPLVHHRTVKRQHHEANQKMIRSLTQRHRRSLGLPNPLKLFRFNLRSEHLFYFPLAIAMIHDSPRPRKQILWQPQQRHHQHSEHD